MIINGHDPLLIQINLVLSVLLMKQGILDRHPENPDSIILGLRNENYAFSSM